MQPVLETLNAVPGVVGSLLCTPEGRVLAHAFPPTFDEPVLEEAAAVLADGSVGLETVTGPIGLVDLRYAESRVVVKPLTGGLLLLLCTKSVNLQLLVISVSVATKKIERILDAPANVPSAASAAAPPDPAEAADAEAPDEPSGPEKPKRKSKWWPSV